MQKMQTPTSVGAIVGDGGRKVGAAALWRERPRFYDVNERKRIRRSVNKRVCDPAYPSDFPSLIRQGAL